MVHMAKEDIVKMQIKRIENEIRDTPYNKSTERHIGLLRAKISKLKDKLLSSQGKGGGGGGGYAVRKQGDATVVLVGPPSAGKSTLINLLTNAESKVAPYAFTTVSVIPGMMEYKKARIQILDVPGLIEGAEEGKGRGREVLSVVRGSDLLVIITDVNRIGALQQITDALERNGIRVNKEKPQVKIEKKLKGGIIIHSNIKQELSRDTIKDVASEMGYKNAEISIKEKVTINTLIDVFSKNRVYIPAIYVVNKADLKKVDTSNIKSVALSAEKRIGIENLLEEIWKKLGFATVYLVRQDEEPGHNNPMIMKNGDTLNDVAEKIGTEFAEGKSKAKIWGEGAKFPSQEVSLTTKIEDGMMVRFI